MNNTLIAMLTFAMLPVWCMSQTPKILAKDAHKYAGRVVMVHDSVYGGQVVNDSTTVYYIGANENKHPLTIIFCTGSNLKLSQPERHIRTMQSGKFYLIGMIFMINKNPFMVIKNLRDLAYDMPLPD